MESEVKEKLEHKDGKDGKRKSVSITLKGIPMSVHNRVKSFKREINKLRDKDLTIKQAYVEYLKESVKHESKSL